MKKTLLMIVIITVCLSVKSFAQDNEAGMKAWQTYMTPGDVHKMLAQSDGDWNEEVTFWMQPGAPPTTSKSKVHNEMILGGRYQLAKHTGDMMGMPFEGMNLLGYDNAKKIFISTWIDNMGTGVMTLQGPWDEKTNTVNLKGVEVDPMTGKDMNVRETFQIIDKDTQKLEMFTIINGKESKTMVINLTRNK